MSLLTLAEARGALIGLALDDDPLQAAIDEEEAWLARRIGPLVGERTERFPLAYLRPQHSHVILRRPAGLEYEIIVNGIDVTTTSEPQANGWRIVLLPEGTRYSGIAAVTYTPDDELEVRRALKELLGITLGVQVAGGLQAETIGSYSYQRAAGSAGRLRRSIVRDLLRPPQAGSLHIRSSVRHGLAGVLDR